MVKDRRGGGGSLSSLAHAGLIKIAQGARGTRTMNPADSIEGAEFRDLLTSYVDIGTVYTYLPSVEHGPTSLTAAHIGRQAFTHRQSEELPLHVDLSLGGDSLVAFS